MANRKQQYRWPKVKPGNIISFKYKSKRSGKARIQTILVLNPRLPVVLKDGKKTRHLIGIKLEESNKITLRMTKRQLNVLERIGEFINTDKENNLYKLVIDRRYLLNNVKGVKQEAWLKISKALDIKGQYRTYDYRQARNSAVYLEPIRVFAEVKEADEVELTSDRVKVKKPKKPKQPKKPKKETKKPEQPKKPKQPKKSKDEKGGILEW
tara:strand:+ start:1538 stop:2167 length:630 start_codon:yes stop_codon:yes gene_type:complete